MRAALYARVSTEEQAEGYSLDAQARAFRHLCEEKGWTIYREYIEAGRSAHTEDVRKRPVFKEATEAALAGEYDVLVVHKIDRFSRRLRITLEYFDKLAKAGVGFVSIQNQMDYSTPHGKFMLAMQGGLAELYSENLGEETKKGWHERKEQGLYCGPLPFGVMKGEDGVPVPRPDTYPGLVMAFELAAQGRSHRDIAMALNVAGYRTTKGRPFSKDSVDDMLRNRFYLGQLAKFDGRDHVLEWVPGKHHGFVPEETFDAAQVARERNRKFSARTTRADARLSSLSGVARCGECGATLRTYRQRGVARLVCNTRLKNGQCSQKSGRLEWYEGQLLQYLEAFHIPDDYQQKILEAHRKLLAAYDDVEKRGAQLQSAITRLQELYQWGHKSRDEYLAEYEALARQLKAIEPPARQEQALERLAAFLKDVALAWREANEEQKGGLTQQLFEAVWIKNQHLEAVTPRAEFKPFFDLAYDRLSKYVLQWRPGGDSNPRSPA